MGGSVEWVCLQNSAFRSLRIYDFQLARNAYLMGYVLLHDIITSPLYYSRRAFANESLTIQYVAKNPPLLYGLSGHLKENEKMETIFLGDIFKLK